MVVDHSVEYGWDREVMHAMRENGGRSAKTCKAALISLAPIGLKPSNGHGGH